MNIFVTYASDSGSTQSIAEVVAETLRSAENEVTVKEATEASMTDATQADLVLIGSPSYEVEGMDGMPHRNILEFLVKLESGDLSGKKFGFFGCGDSSYPKFCGAMDKLEDFGKSANVEQITDSLRLDQYYMDMEGNNTKASEWAQGLLSNAG